MGPLRQRTLYLTQMPPMTASTAATAPRVASRRNIGLGLALVALIVSPLLILHAINKLTPGATTDLLPRWIGSRAALEGKNPYSAEVLGHIQTRYYGHPLSCGDTRDPMQFLYPAPIILLIAPLSRLSWATTGLVFLLITCPLLALSLWLCIRSLGLRLLNSQTTLIVVLAFFSWPVMWGLRLQQPTLIVAILLFAVCSLLGRGDEIAPGVLLAMATIKPQLTLPLLIWLVLWALIRRSWAFLASLAGTVALMWYATDRIVPHWFTLWRASLRGYTGVTRSRLPLEVMVGHWPGLAVTAILATACAVTLWRLRRAAPGSAEFGIAVSLALAGTLNLVPGHILMIYNDVLLFPAFVLLWFAKPSEWWAGLLRFLALAILGMEFVTVIVCGFGAASGHGISVWTGLPLFEFPDDLLPALVTAFLVLRGTSFMASVQVRARTPGELVLGSEALTLCGTRVSR